MSTTKSHNMRTALMILLSPIVASAAPIIMPTHVGPSNYDTGDFAIARLGTSIGGTPFGVGSPTLATAAVGADITQGIEIDGPAFDRLDLQLPYAVSLGSSITIWEAGDPADHFHLFVSTDLGTTWFGGTDPGGIIFTPVITSPLDTSSGYNTNTAFINLSVFLPSPGLNPGDLINAIRISGGNHPTDHSDILAVAATPEPGTLGLLLVGALGVLNRRRRCAQGLA